MERPTLQIRAAEDGDYETFVRLVAELSTDDPVPNRERWADQIQPTMMIAERHGAVAGYAQYRVLDAGTSRTVHLGHLVTDPASRRSGTGRALIAATHERARALGATHLTLNVKRTNAPAIALYESEGFRPFSRSFVLRMPWSAILAQPAPHLDAVRPLAAEEDRALEARLGFTPGQISLGRRYPDRLLSVIEPATFGCFDPGFGGANPFAMESVAHGLSLLRAFHAHRLPEHDAIVLSIADDEAKARRLVEAGAHLRFETIKMQVALATS